MNEINPYESPKQASTDRTADKDDGGLPEGVAATAWRSEDFVFALVQQAVLLLLTSLVLDGGFLFRVCLTAVTAHWIWIGTAVVRRRTSPTAWDIALVKFGFLLCLLLTFAAAYAVAAIWARR
jgi:hypothetical protein